MKKLKVNDAEKKALKQQLDIFEQNKESILKELTGKPYFV